jgi:DNA-binding MarR family transcriptional regulator
MNDDFTQCMVSNTRMAARAITRRYDTYLRGLGITATQLSLLGWIRLMPGSTVTELAEGRGFERTTLTRNLNRLESMGLVRSRPAKHGNGRICEMTEAGEALIETAAPLWRKAQAELRQALTPDGFDTALATLKRLAAVQTENTGA